MPGPSEEQFLEAVLEGEVDTVRAALEATPELVQARDEHLGSTALHFAAHRGFAEIVSALLGAGAEVDAREKVSGTTPLHWAAEAGQVEVIERLLGCGASPGAIDGWYGLQPLGWATVVQWAPGRHRDRAGAVNTLLGAGAQVDVFSAIARGSMSELDAALERSPEDRTRRLGWVANGLDPVGFATRRGQPALLERLLELGAPAEGQTLDGLTPLAIALREGKIDCVQLLLAHGAGDDIASALMRRDARGMATHAVTRARAEALLFAAAGFGWAPAIPALVEQGADPNVTALRLSGEVPAQLSPLQVAAEHGHAELIRALLQRGARVDGADPSQTPTPLHLAAGEGHLEAVRVLLVHEARQDLRDLRFGATAREWAEFAGHTEVVELLATPVPTHA